MKSRFQSLPSGISFGFLALGVALSAAGCGAEQASGGDDGDNASGTGGAGAAGASGTSGSGAGQGGAVTGGTAGTSTGGAGTGGTAGAGTSGTAGSSGAVSGGSGGSGGTSGAGGAAAGGGKGGAGTGGMPTGGAGAGGGGNCMTPPAPSALIGWATQGSGTTGGGNATPMIVTSASQFTSAIMGNGAAVIHLNGNISGTFTVGSNKTIIGVCGATITGAVNMNMMSQNVIMRNLKVVGNNCTDSVGNCSGGEDAIGVNGGAHHLWFDHLDVSDGSDGNLDMTQGADFITISWTKFSYSTRRTDPVSGADGHRFSNLIGASDTDPSDVNHLNITFHHNWWADNIDQRMPRSRRGNIHVLNNLYTPTGNSYCTNAGQDAKLLVENNIYIGVNNPLQVANNGSMRSVGNVFMNTSGTMSANGTGFTPTYTYSANPTSGLEAAIRSGVGPK